MDFGIGTRKTRRSIIAVADHVASMIHSFFPYYENEHKFACIRGHDFNLGLSIKEEPAPVSVQ